MAILNVSPFLESLLVEFVPYLGYLVSVDGEYNQWDDTDFTLIYSDNDGQQYLKHPIVQELDNTLGDLRSQMEIEAAAILLDVEDHVLNQEVLLQSVSSTLAKIDAIASLGIISKERNFVQPNMTERPIIAVQHGVSLPKGFGVSSSDSHVGLFSLSLSHTFIYSDTRCTNYS